MNDSILSACSIERIILAELEFLQLHLEDGAIFRPLGHIHAIVEPANPQAAMEFAGKYFARKVRDSLDLLHGNSPTCPTVPKLTNHEVGRWKSGCPHCLTQNVTQRKWLPQIKCYRKCGGSHVGGATVWFVNRQEALDPNAGRVLPCY